MSSDRTLRRWRQRARDAYYASPEYRAAQRRRKRRKLHFPLWAGWTPELIAWALRDYCKQKGRELGGRPPAARRCTKRLPPGRGRQCWGWRTQDSDRCWRHQRAPAA